MSLCSLKKSTPSAKPVEPVSVDEFIDDALAYAAGNHVIRQIYPATDSANKDNITPCGPMRRATFTLSEDAIEKLGKLSAETGICRSRLIRIWIENQSSEDIRPLLTNKTP